MSTTSAARVQRRPLAPVRVDAAFTRLTDALRLARGTGALVVTDLDTGKAEYYWTRATLDAGRLVGLVVTKMATDLGQYEPYHVALVPEPSCTCADATYRPERPGGCRHVAAARLALARMAERPEAEPLPF
jgi:hypothetical protein